jgi:hypothetical protein
LEEKKDSKDDQIREIIFIKESRKVFREVIIIGK